jgi:hypothetical protein
MMAETETKNEESNNEGIPRIVLAHRSLQVYWNTWVRLWYLAHQIGELGSWETDEFEMILRNVLLLPSSLLVGICRIPFFPLDIYNYARKKLCSD